MPRTRKHKIATGRRSNRRSAEPKVHAMVRVDDDPLSEVWESRCRLVKHRSVVDNGTVQDVTCDRCWEHLPTPPFEARHSAVVR